MLELCSVADDEAGQQHLHLMLRFQESISEEEGQDGTALHEVRAQRAVLMMAEHSVVQPDLDQSDRAIWMTVLEIAHEHSVLDDPLIRNIMLVSLLNTHPRRRAAAVEAVCRICTQVALAIAGAGSTGWLASVEDARDCLRSSGY